MPKIILETKIKAPIDRVFDLARSIDLHTQSTSKTNERAVAGVTKGLIGLGETVTWEARHLGFTQRLTSEIVVFDRPNHFRDSMQKGAFARLDHDHFFEEVARGTLMRDVFDFTSPFWVVGTIADLVFLKNYMRRFLLDRNRMIKQTAEGDDWKELVNIS
ncbi:MAG: SRPBCC family protein [Pyrinomonadaceae bacterium]|nr:SRPBCC family protein [Pyrinomonadaceae bacterium]